MSIIFADDNKTIIIEQGETRTCVPDYTNAPSDIRAKIDALGGLEAVQPYAAPPPPVPSEISPSQLFEGLARAGLITSDEAIAAARTGEVPAKIDALFATLPDDQALAARIKWARMGTVERKHPLVAALAAANKLTSEEIDDAFRAWSAL